MWFVEKNACVKDIPYRSDRQKKIIEFGDVLAVWKSLVWKHLKLK